MILLGYKNWQGLEYKKQTSIEALNTVTIMFYWDWNSTGNQCREIRVGVLWSCFIVLIIKLAAVFYILWSLDRVPLLIVFENIVEFRSLNKSLWNSKYWLIIRWHRLDNCSHRYLISVVKVRFLSPKKCRHICHRKS